MSRCLSNMKLCMHPSLLISMRLKSIIMCHDSVLKLIPLIPRKEIFTISRQDYPVSSALTSFLYMPRNLAIDMHFF